MTTDTIFFIVITVVVVFIFLFLRDCDIFSRLRRNKETYPYVELLHTNDLPHTLARRLHQVCSVEQMNLVHNEAIRIRDKSIDVKDQAIAARLWFQNALERTNVLLFLSHPYKNEMTQLLSNALSCEREANRNIIISNAIIDATRSIDGDDLLKSYVKCSHNNAQLWVVKHRCK